MNILAIVNNESSDIKATKWKKFGPFLNEQASLGIVSIRDNQTLTAVNKGHIALRDARKEKKKEQEEGNGRTPTSGKTRMAIVALNIVPARQLYHCILIW